MSVSLSLKSRRRGEKPPIESGHYVLQGESEWLLSGDDEQLIEIKQSLPGIAERLSADLLLLDFGNAVGFFTVPFLGRIEVISGKWGRPDFDRMLLELTEVAAGLPFAGRVTGALPYDRSAIGQEAVLYHAFVHLRYALSSAPPFHERLLPALRVVLSEPHRLFARVRREVGPSLVSRVDARTLQTIASGRHKLLEVPLEQGGRIPVAIALGGYLPEFLDEPHVQVNYDTPENRFVKSMLSDALWIVSRMRAVVRALAAPDIFFKRILDQCDEMEKQLNPIVRDPLWRQIGSMVHVPTGSTVLQRRRGYREVYRHFVKSRLSARVPLAPDELMDLLEAKDVAQLYELWAYFTVVRELESLLGLPSKFERLKIEPMQVLLPYKFEVAWADGTRAIFNPSFSRSDKGAGFAYSVPLRPDIAVEVPTGINAGLHLFDAKFRLEKFEEVLREAEQGSEKPSETDSDERKGTFKRGDLYKMHTYRDAIPRARSVWALYPGNDLRFFSIEERNADVGKAPQKPEGVGAIPLKPDSAIQPQLRSVLENLFALGDPHN